MQIYVQLTVAIKKLDTAVFENIVEISAFERDFSKYNIDLLENFNVIKSNLRSDINLYCCTS